MQDDDGKPRTLAPSETCSIRIFNSDSGVITEIFRSDEILLEAPNWADPDNLILNGNGMLWRLDLRGGSLEKVVAHGLPPLNNDHVLAGDGKTIFVSGFDWHIHRLSFDTGVGERITPDDAEPRLLYFLHGVCPDDSELAFVGMTLTPTGDIDSTNLFTLSLTNANVKQLTFGRQRDDGCEYSNDGEWIYYNTEMFGIEAGHAQIARISRRTGDIERLTVDDRVNWFPHVPPIGDLACYLSYPPGTIGHPAGCDVELRLVRGHRWSSAETVTRVRGGQGTINVNSWSPDGRRFAFVAYPAS